MNIIYFFINSENIDMDLTKSSIKLYCDETGDREKIELELKSFAIIRNTKYCLYLINQEISDKDELRNLLAYSRRSK